MYRSTCATALALLAGLALTACGGESGPQMRLHFVQQRLLTDVARVQLYYYGADRSCDEIRSSRPRPSSVLGPFSIPLNDDARRVGVIHAQDRVPIGTYLIFADALEAQGGLIGTGCTPGQQVRQGELSLIDINISSESGN